MRLSLVLLCFLLHLLALIPSARCFLFGRSTNVVPPVTGVVHSILVIDFSRRQALICDDVGYLSLTSAFTSTDDMFVTRSAPVTKDNAQLFNYDPVLDPVTEVAWALYDDLSVRAISLRDWSISAVFNFSDVQEDVFVTDWTMGIYSTGIWFPVIGSLGGLYWFLPNDTLAEYSDYEAPIDVYYIVGNNQLYGLSFTWYDANITAIHVNLETGDITLSSAYALPNATERPDRTQCVLQYNATTIAYLIGVNSSDVRLLFLDVVSLSFSSMPLASLGFDMTSVTPSLTCKPLAAPGHYLLWHHGLSLSRGSIYVLNVSAATIQRVDLPHSIGVWSAVQVTPSGDLVAASCLYEPFSSHTFAPPPCNLLWFPAFDTAALPSRPAAYVRLGAASATYNVALPSSAPALGDVVAIYAEYTGYLGPNNGFLVVSASSAPSSSRGSALPWLPSTQTVQSKLAL